MKTSEILYLYLITLLGTWYSECVTGKPEDGCVPAARRCSEEGTDVNIGKSHTQAGVPKAFPEANSRLMIINLLMTLEHDDATRYPAFEAGYPLPVRPGAPVARRPSTRASCLGTVFPITCRSQ